MDQGQRFDLRPGDSGRVGIRAGEARKTGCVPLGPSFRRRPGSGLGGAGAGAPAFLASREGTKRPGARSPPVIKVTTKTGCRFLQRPGAAEAAPATTRPLPPPALTRRGPYKERSL